MLTYVDTPSCLLKGQMEILDPSCQGTPDPGKGKGGNWGIQMLRHLYTTAWARLVLFSLRSHFLVTTTLGFGTRLCYHLIGNYAVIRHYDWRICSSITLVLTGKKTALQ